MPSGNEEPRDEVVDFIALCLSAYGVNTDAFVVVSQDSSCPGVVVTDIVYQTFLYL